FRRTQRSIWPLLRGITWAVKRRPHVRNRRSEVAGPGKLAELQTHSRQTPGSHAQDISIRDLAAETVVDRLTGEPVGELYIERLMNPGRTSAEEFTRHRTRFLE